MSAWYVKLPNPTSSLLETSLLLTCLQRFLVNVNFLQVRTHLTSSEWPDKPGTSAKETN